MSIREKFPIFEQTAFINSCSKGALSNEVKQAYLDYLNDWEEQGSPWELWVDKLEEFRGAFAHLIHAKRDEVAVTTSVSAGVNAVASALCFDGERNGIVVDDFAFPTTAQIWHAQEQRGARVTHVSETAEGGRIPLEAYESAITEKTLLVSVTHVCYRHGGMQNLAEIAKIARRKGAMILVDSYQGLGTIPIDVKALDLDFLVGGTLKYLLGSSGLGMLYVRNNLISQLRPTNSGWFGQADIFAMDIYGNDPSPTGRRFESGTPPNPNVYAGIAGLKLIDSVGVENIDAHRREITGMLKAGAHAHGFTLACPANPDEHGPMIGLKSNDVEQLVGRLAADGVIVSSRDGNLRISPHIYNNGHDIDRLIDGLLKNKELLINS